MNNLDFAHSYLQGDISLDEAITLFRSSPNTDEDHDVDKDLDKICAGYQYDKFIEDKSLSSHISVFKNEEALRAHLLSDEEYTALCGSIIHRRSMMLAQSFMLKAAKNRSYNLYQENGQMGLSSAISIPCFYNHIAMIAIPFDLPIVNQRIFVLCNEFWGHPCGIINFKARTYYSDFTSPKLRVNTYPSCLMSVAASIVAWISVVASKSANNGDKASIALFTGGSPNPSHAHWNYLGGLNLFAKLIKDFDNVHTLQLTDLIFPNPYKCFQLHNVSALSPIKKYQYLAANKEIAQPLWVRFSDAGLNPVVSNDIAHKVAEMVETDTSLKAGASSLINGGRPFAFTPPKVIQHIIPGPQHSIVLTLRGGRRKIYKQAQTYADLIEQLVRVLGSLTIFLDGSTNSVNNQAIKTSESKEFALLSEISAIKRLVSTGKLVLVNLLNSCIDIQLCHFAGCSTFLTYSSGGNAKFCPFLRQAGIVVGPSCETSRSAVLSMVAAYEAGVFIPNHWKTLFPNELIYVPHDRIAYSHLLTPSIARNCQPVNLLVDEVQHFNPDFQQDFFLDVDSTSALMLALIHANSFTDYTPPNVRSSHAMSVDCN
jgi:hypothetical protein